MNHTKMLEQKLQNLAHESIKRGDTQFASAYKNKKLSDCVTAIMKAMFIMASENRSGKNCCGIDPSDNVLSSAMVHWYTESDPSVESVADILKGEFDCMAMNVSKPTTTPKASTPKKNDKPKTSAPAPTTAPPFASPAMTVVPPAPVQVPAMVEDDDDDFDPLA